MPRVLSVDRHRRATGERFLANVLLIKDNRVKVFIEANGNCRGPKSKINACGSSRPSVGLICPLTVPGLALDFLRPPEEFRRVIT